MTKRQWFLVAGTVVLAACPSSLLLVCDTVDEETGAITCERKPIVEIPTTPPSEDPEP